MLTNWICWKSVAIQLFKKVFKIQIVWKIKFCKKFKILTNLKNLKCLKIKFFKKFSKNLENFKFREFKIFEKVYKF